MFHFLTIILIFPYCLFCMEKHSNLSIIPNELQIKIFTIPDYSLLTKIITIQKEINQLQSNTNYKIKKPKQKSFFEIQKALFPCFAITQTCKKFNQYEFKQLIAQISLNLLLEVFPQGIALFLLPKPLQITFVDRCQKINDDLYAIINVCFDDKNEFCQFKNLPFNSILNNPNSIIYVKNSLKGSEPNIESYTIIEYILCRLSYNIAYSGRVSDYFPDTQEIKEGWKKFFIVIDYLCSLDTIDLSLPAAQRNTTIAQAINEKFNKSQYPTDLFSEKSNNNLNNPVPSGVIIQEQELLLHTLANTYLGIISEEEQKNISEYRLKKEAEEKKQKIYEESEKTRKKNSKKRKFLKNLIKVSIISILFLVTTICVFKKNIIHDTYFSVIHPFCKLFYHR